MKLIILLVVAAIMFIPATVPAQTITGCLTPRGLIVKVNEGDEPKSPCNSRQTQISWQQQGEKGDQGDPGQKGDQGDPGQKGDQGDPSTDTVGSLMCMDGEIPKYNATSNLWECAADEISPSDTKLVFVTSAKYDGALEPDPDGCGNGNAGADCICQFHADQAGLSGMFRAWISTTASSPAANFTRSDSPYVRVDGAIVAMNWNDLTDGTLLSAIEIDESSNHVTVIVDGKISTTDSTALNNTVFTGTGIDGSSIIEPSDDSPNCEEWTQTTGNARVGNLYHTSGNDWTTVGRLHECSDGRRLYCFEQ